MTAFFWVWLSVCLYGISVTIAYYIMKRYLIKYGFEPDFFDIFVVITPVINVVIVFYLWVTYLADTDKIASKFFRMGDKHHD